MRTVSIIFLAATLLLLVPVLAGAKEAVVSPDNMLTDSSAFFYTRARSLAVDELPQPFSQPTSALTEAGKADRVFFTVKTNLLYDVLTMLNMDIEIPVGKNFSVLLEDVFPWWHVANIYCLQHWEMGPEVRYWFRGKDSDPMRKLSGWFVGVYGMSSKYDFQYRAKLNYQGEYWSAGLTAGWSMYLTGRNDFLKEHPLLLEFSASAGYLRTDYRHYLPADDYSLLIRDKYNIGSVSYFGPTKLKISVVVPILRKSRAARQVAKSMN